MSTRSRKKTDIRNKVEIVEWTGPSPLMALLAGLVQWIVLTIFLMLLIDQVQLANLFVSTPLWQQIVSWLGGSVEQSADLGLISNVPLPSVALASLLLTGLVNLVLTLVLRRQQKIPTVDAALSSIVINALWTTPIAVWAVMCLANLSLQSEWLAGMVILTAALATSVTLAGWLWEIARVAVRSTARESEMAPTTCPYTGVKSVLLGMLCYVVVFVAMNWGLWFNLQIPHGDSAMYEQHIWNFMNGKGFRSYLDQGLFLGEHIQVIHLGLLPIYYFWPSHLLLELANSAAIALCALPVYRIAFRHTGHQRGSTLVAYACLMYFPLQYLDIAIDLKTFRPSSFGIPAMLFAIDAMEQRRWRRMTFAFLVALASQEDFALVIGPLGLWLAATQWVRLRKDTDPAARQQVIIGLTTCLLAAIYLAFVLKVAIPYFRAGEEVHYTSYFQDFGNNPTEIVWNMLTKPWLLISQLLIPGSIAYFLYLLVPLGMPLRAWSQLLVASPIFVLLCLNKLAHNPPGPFHHFHAPLIAVLLWAACCSLSIKGPSCSIWQRIKAFFGLDEGHSSSGTTPVAGCHAGGEVSHNVVFSRTIWIFLSAFACSLFFSLSPLSFAFWDSGQRTYWKRLYLQDERAKEFEKIPPLIPQTARVASTDFVHPRFTHYERSYDYSAYPRMVADYEDKVPDDTDYIVIDTQHPYSTVRRLEDLREYQREPDRWEVLPIETNGYYIVLKRIPEASESSSPEPSASVSEPQP